MIVADANVALKWFFGDEPLAEEAAAIIRSGIPVIAPDLVVAEVANAAWRWSRLGRIRPEEAHRIATRLPGFFQMLVPAAELVEPAMRLAHDLDHPIYDCLYLALANREEVALVTADARLIEKVGRTTRRKRVVALSRYRAGGS
jgi:predicted nucleic acid-binding protein